jgi:hypothetical protein
MFILIEKISIHYQSELYFGNISFNKVLDARETWGLLNILLLAYIPYFKYYRNIEHMDEYHGN